MSGVPVRIEIARMKVPLKALALLVNHCFIQVALLLARGPSPLQIQIRQSTHFVSVISAGETSSLRRKIRM